MVLFTGSPAPDTIQPVLVARNLWRLYDNKAALKGLDFEVAKGSAYGFIGPNGAGKSTTLRILATVDRPDAGRVWINGLDTQHNAVATRRSLGFMPDPFHLYEELTVTDLLRFFAQAYQIPVRDRRARLERVIELTRIGEVKGQTCNALSKGWRQRVLLAKTLIHDPSLLLLDEPAAGLDPAARIEFREIVRTLRELGKTIVVSSHILTELADFCDSVGIIERGRMLVSGKIEDILHRLEPSDRLELELVGDAAAGERAATRLGERADVASVEVSEGPEGTTRVVATLRGRSTPSPWPASCRPSKTFVASIVCTRPLLAEGRTPPTPPGRVWMLSNRSLVRRGWTDSSSWFSLTWSQSARLDELLHLTLIPTFI